MSITNEPMMLLMKLMKKHPDIESAFAKAGMCRLTASTFINVERFCRSRFLHRERHPLRSAVDLCRLLWYQVEPVSPYDTS